MNEDFLGCATSQIPETAQHACLASYVAWVVKEEGAFMKMRFSSNDLPHPHIHNEKISNFVRMTKLE